MQYCKGIATRSADLPESLFEAERGRQQERLHALTRAQGKENVYKLHDILGSIMTNNATVVRYNQDLEHTLQVLSELKSRSAQIGIHTKSQLCNQELLFVNHFRNMLELAEVITKGALARNESRGAHYKPDYPDRNDPDWLKTTAATYTAAGASLTYLPVDTSLIPPRPRVYDVDKKKAA
jgi:succinate dehydrogenase / fumarate reductase flavoprotein subunit